MNYEESLMVKAAWYYYFENMTQQAIAERLSVSRMRVIRLLENARQTGIIQFRLRSDGVSVMEQSQQLMEKYHLKDVFLIPETSPGEAHPNESVARAGAMYIADRLGEEGCINVGYGDTISRTLNHLATMVQNPVTCISLTGGVSNYLPNTRSNVFNAKLCLMPAPLLCGNGSGHARGKLRKRNHPHDVLLFLYIGGHRCAGRKRHRVPYRIAWADGYALPENQPRRRRRARSLHR